MDVRQIEEAARQEATRRGYGPRMADWFARGAYAAASALPDTNAPHYRPKRAWWFDGFRWAQNTEVA